MSKTTFRLSSIYGCAAVFVTIAATCLLLVTVLSATEATHALLEEGTSSILPVMRAARNDTAGLFTNFGKTALASWTQRSSAHKCMASSPTEIFFDVKDPGLPQGFAPAKSRTCTFRNLCWSGEKLIYFRDASLAFRLPFEHSNAAGPLFSPPDPLLDMGASSHIYGAPDDWMHLSVEDGPIPANYTMANDSEVVHLLVTPRILPPNPGHELSDSTWPAFSALLDAGMLALDNQIVLMPSGSPNGAPGTYGTVSLSLEPPRSFDSLSRRPGRSVMSYSPRTCFSWAVAGNGGRNLFGQPMPSPFSWRMLHDFVFQRYELGANGDSVGASAAVQATKLLRIVVRYKESKHAFNNYDALLAELTRCYPTASVALYIHDQNQTFRDEFLLLSQADVYITPGGGGSFSAVFLPNDAVVIYGAACWPATQFVGCASPTAGGVCCVQVERHLWSRLQHLHVGYYSYTGPARNLTVRAPGAIMEQMNYDYPVEFGPLFDLVDRGLLLSKGRIFRNELCQYLA